jgi:recombination protein RecR
MNRLEPLDTLVAALSRLPGIGRRTAERMALALVQDQHNLMRLLASALLAADAEIVCCSRCGGLTLASDDPCRLCAGPRKEPHLLCVVEQPGDIDKIEASGGFGGRYHALMGKLSPMHGVGVGDLRVDLLLRRLTDERISEVLIALGTDVESDATAMYLSELLIARGVTVSRLAFGLPAGSAIEYSDSATLSRAISGRQKMG